MKRKITAIFITLVALLMLCLSACGKVEFKVNFVVDGEIYATVDTNGNEVIKIPENPTKEGYNFDGWYWDKDEWEKPFTANSLLDAPLSSDMSVYAKFVSNEVPLTQDFVVSALKTMPNIVAVSAATEYNDPNGQLNKPGGYIADIFFSVDVINQNLITGTTLVEKGTDAGGSIEIYRTQKDAEKRNEYLAAFDGGILSSGSHKVIGTCVVRTSDSLTASLQNILENNIEKALTGSTEAFVSMDTYLIEIAKQVAEEEKLSEFEVGTKLIEFGYPLEKAEAIAKICGANFNEIAKGLAEGYADYYATVYPTMIAELLADHEFTEANIEYALENADIDWQFYAKIHARDFVNMNEEEYYISPLDVIVHLNNDKGYTVEDSEYGVWNCEINWNEKALEYIECIEADGILGPKGDYITALTDMEFTQAQAQYAVNNCGNNWNNHALLCLKHFVEDLSTTTPNHAECLAKLKDWGFSDSEANYAISNYDGLIYPDKLDYVIHFNTDGGELSSLTQNVVFGKTYTLPTPTKTGYTFKGWYNGTTEVTAGTWYTASDVTLKAKWEITSYIITYNLNNGTNNSSNENTYTMNDAVVLYAPTRTGYTFTGWTYSGQTTPVMNVTIQKGTTGNKTYTANWQANTYTVTYKVNGGTLADLTVDVVYGSYFKPATPTRTGYSFNGWHYDSGKGYDEEYCNDYYGIAGNVTLEAWWNANTYTITYNANGGTVSGTTQSVAYDSTYTLRTPTRTGYEFLGWYNSGNKVENGTWTSTQGIALKAEWKANTYTITFNANNGSVTPTSATATYDSSITLPTPTRTGYTFSGWYNGSTKYTTGTWKTAGDTMLTAKWTARTDITYVVHHYQQNITDNEYTLFETQNLKGTADASIKPATNSYTGFTAPTKQTVTVKPDGSLVVNYYYTRNSYSITFVTNGGDTITKITQKYQSELSVPDATRDGFTFGGWYTNTTLTTSYTKPTTMPATSRTVYAYWAEENKPSDFTYSGSSAITVSAYKGTSTTMWIPSYIGGKAVTTISSSAFKNNTTITKVVVPNTVTSIGGWAFYNCSAIEEMTLPFVGNNESATENYQQVFGYIFGYTTGNDISSSPSDYIHTSSSYGYTPQTIYLDGQYYREARYYIPQSIKSVTITKQLDIPENAFRNCDLIEEIRIPSGVKSIGNYAFCNCEKVKGYNTDQNGYSVLPTALTTIPNYAFAGNKSLSKVIVPIGIVEIQSYAFSDCNSLTEFITNNSITQLKSIGASAFKGCTAITKYFNGEAYELMLPNGLESIGSSAFSNNILLKKVIVPNTVTIIGGWAFYNCSAIEEMTLPFVGNSESATENYQQVFGYIFGYTTGNDIAASPSDIIHTSASYDYTPQTVYLDGQYYREARFFIPESVRKVTITKQIAIPENAFRNCDLIEEISLPDGTTSIGASAFRYCESINTIYIPSSVNTVGEYAFKGCTSLTINCGAVSLPTGWASNWNSSNCEVAWNKSKS